MARYRCVSYHPVTRQQLSPSLRFIDPAWSWAVGGNGSFSGKIAVPDNAQQIQQLELATRPKQAAIYVKNEQGQFPWGGPIIDRTWDPAAGTISVSAMEWRAWLYQIKLGPKIDMTADIRYSWAGVDQTTMFRDIVSYAIAGGQADGRPPIMLGTEPLSGKVRDLNIWGTALKSPGELIDSISQRDGGFDWSLVTRPHPMDGAPQVYAVTYFPEQGSVIPGLMFAHTERSGNLTKYGPVKEDQASKVERFWATGVGSAPDQVFAQDTDPGLTDGQTLLFEGGTNYSNISDRTTLASHARASRAFYTPGFNLMPVEHALGKPDVDSYGVGDRARLKLKDRWLDWDVDAVRIVEKSVSRQGVKLTLDLVDYVLPEVDAGGSV